MGPFFDLGITEKRDAAILSKLSDFLNDEAKILDVGCGTGRLSKKIMDEYDIQIDGIDVCKFSNPEIKLKLFDGKHIPFEDNSYDAVFLMDVLHHTKNIKPLILEASRVAKKTIVIKDHYYKNFFDLAILKIVDFLGNIFPYVKTPFNFKSKQEWDDLLNGFNYEKIEWRSKVIPFVTCPEIMFKINLDK